MMVETQKITPRMEVVGSDGRHVGTVNQVQGSRVLMLQDDAMPPGRSEMLPLSMIAAVDDKVRLTLPAIEALRSWHTVA